MNVVTVRILEVFEDALDKEIRERVNSGGVTAPEHIILRTIEQVGSAIVTIEDLLAILESVMDPEEHEEIAGEVLKEIDAEVERIREEEKA